MIWTREQAKTLVDRVLSMSKAEETFVVAQRRRPRQPALRAQHAPPRPAPRPATAWRSPRASARSRAPPRPPSSTMRACGGRSRNAEEIARLSPENPEAMPVLGPQTYGAGKAYFDDVGERDAGLARGSAAGTAIELSKQKGVGLGRVRRHVGVDPGGRRRRRGCSATTGRPPPTTT